MLRRFAYENQRLDLAFDANDSVRKSGYLLLFLHHVWNQHVINYMDDTV